MSDTMLVTGARVSTTPPGNMPANRHNAASIAMAATE